MTLQANKVDLAIAQSRLLQGVDVSIAPGEVVVVVGANGAGKSSLLGLLAAESLPTAGDVLLDGEPVMQVPREERATRLAVLPQHAILDFPFTVTEVIEMGRIPQPTGRLANDQVVAQVMARLQLTGLADRVYTTLSGGERQRVQIGRVLCQLWDVLDGGFLLLDEPTAPLDLAHQLAFLDIARELADRGAGVLLVMHDINLALRCADTIVMMKAGEVIAAGPPGQAVTPQNIRAVFDVDVGIAMTDAGGPLVYARPPSRS